MTGEDTRLRRRFENGDFVLAADRTRRGKDRKWLLMGLNVGSLALTLAFLLLGLLILVPMNACPATVTFTLPGLLLWGVLGLAAVAGLVVLHEVLHALGARLLGGAPAGSVRLGFDKKVLAAYAVCAVPLPVKAFRQMALLPLWVCALLPLALGLFLGNVALWALGSILIGGSLGDLWTVWDLRRVPRDHWVLELPPDDSGYAIGYQLWRRDGGEEAPVSGGEAPAAAHAPAQGKDSPAKETDGAADAGGTDTSREG